MIPEVLPYNNYTGNGLVTKFDFDFFIENASQLVVELLNDNSEKTTLEEGVDYTINEFKNPNGSYITYPISGSSHTVLSNKETLTLYLSLPVEQISEYSKSSELDFKLLEYSFDYLTRLIQIIKRGLERCAQLPEGASKTMKELVDEILNANSVAKKWAEYMDGTVDGTGYSAKYHANRAGVFVGFAEAQADRAEAYADKAEFGMQWTEFYEANWTAVDDYYTLVLNDLPVINAVYKGTWNNKELVSGVDVVLTGTGSKLVSKNTFDGYVLSAASVIGKYVHAQTVESDEWVINHNLGHIPHIVLVDDDGFEMVGTRRHVSFNQTIITFDTQQTGKAYLN